MKDEKILPYHECQNYIKCSCNVCPLDPLQDDKESLKGEEKCTLRKATRLKIGIKYSNLLPRQGLTKRQWAGKQLSESYCVAKDVS